MTGQVRRTADSGVASVGNLTGRSCLLRPIEDADIPTLHRIALRRDTGRYWRYRGATPSIQQFAHELWSGGAFTQMVAARRDDAGTALGLVVAYDLSAAGHCKFGAIFDADVLGTVIAGESVRLFIDFLFEAWPLRKVYLETLEPAAERFSSTLDRHAVEEGRLIEHDFVDGRWVDLRVFAIWREHVERDRWRRAGHQKA